MPWGFLVDSLGTPFTVLKGTNSIILKNRYIVDIGGVLLDISHFSFLPMVQWKTRGPFECKV